MLYPQIFSEFTKNFVVNYHRTHRGIGIECEIPVVTILGDAIPLSVIQKMYEFLEKKGFQLKKEEATAQTVAATKVNIESAIHFDFPIDTITTDAGIGILEIALAPQLNLHEVQSQLNKILIILIEYFDTQQCQMLGYGVQPLTPPSRQLLMPKERYLFYEQLSGNQTIPKSRGADAHLLTITASNQCHIDISQQEAIPAINVLNALSGLQIALHANSPIWQGAIDPNYKANREVFWDLCYPERLNQIGIPPKFKSIEDYFQYLLQFKPMLVKRGKQLLQVLGKKTYKNFLLDGQTSIGRTLNGETVVIHPKVKDIHALNSFCYFNARLVPKHGTIESRMCCQQPPKETLTSAALTLGILENLEAAKQLMDKLPWKTWQLLRKATARASFDTPIGEKSILPSLIRIVQIAKQGLQKRRLGEEIFLAPLFKRLKLRQSPADIVITIFKKQGLPALLQHYCFKKEDFVKSEAHTIESQFLYGGLEEKYSKVKNLGKL